jgi:hypothetical protein
MFAARVGPTSLGRIPGVRRTVCEVDERPDRRGVGQRAHRIGTSRGGSARQFIEQMSEVTAGWRHNTDQMPQANPTPAPVDEIATVDKLLFVSERVAE